MHKRIFLLAILLFLTNSIVGLTFIKKHHENTEDILKTYSEINRISPEKSKKEIYTVMELTKLQENKINYTEKTDKFLVLNLINAGYKNPKILKNNLFLISKHIKVEEETNIRLFYLDFATLFLFGIILTFPLLPKRRK